MDDNLSYNVFILNTNKLIDCPKKIQKRKNSIFFRQIQNKFLNDYLNKKIDEKTKKIFIFITFFLFLFFLVIFFIFAFGKTWISI